jgi:hypothetical protein
VLLIAVGSCSQEKDASAPYRATHTCCRSVGKQQQRLLSRTVQPRPQCLAMLAVGVIDHVHLRIIRLVGHTKRERVSQQRAAALWPVSHTCGSRQGVALWA